MARSLLTLIITDTSSYSRWWPGHSKRQRYYTREFDADFDVGDDADDDEEWW